MTVVQCSEHISTSSYRWHFSYPQLQIILHYANGFLHLINSTDLIAWGYTELRGRVTCPACVRPRD